jgi:hypothetical protein
MRFIRTLFIGAAFVSTAYAANPPYEVIAYSPTLASTAGDDTRPTIAGTVVRVTPGEVDLAGGPRVPAAASVQLGQWATFVCDHIDTHGPLPAPDHCTLRAAEFRKQPARGQLW